MTADVRSLVGGLPEKFDLDTPSGIIFLLRAIRASKIEAADKNKLKDLVFLFNTGAKDESIKKKLVDLLTSLDVTPQSVLLEAPKEVAQNLVGHRDASKASFPVGRLVPIFNTPVPASVVNAVKSVTTPTPTLTPAPAPAQVLSQVMPLDLPVAEVTVVTPVSVTPVEKNTLPVPSPVTVASHVGGYPVSKMMPEKIIPNNVEVAKKVEIRQVEVPKNLEKTVTPTTYPQGATNLTAVSEMRMERIRLIKADVNSKVGNPVNLIDVDNNVGREYMSALLEAMKLLTSASEIESKKAMARLETVYSKVLLLLVAVQTKDNTTLSDLSRPVAPESFSQSADLISVVVPVVPVNNFAVRSKVTEKTDDNMVASGWEAAALPVEHVSSVAQALEKDDAVVVSRLSTAPAEPLREVVAAVSPTYQSEIAQSVGQIQPLRAITDLPTAQEVSANEAMNSNPLFTKDVDAGLDQLLSEWSIFKKSGLFGSGPKGREHPLYVKISALSVPLILSGRFEGSTQEIKQSITDYMNGWRYEQGIVYEVSETLDQYLRRVIRHIIDLQKTKRRS